MSQTRAHHKHELPGAASRAGNSQAHLYGRWGRHGPFKLPPRRALQSLVCGGRRRLVPLPSKTALAKRWGVSPRYLGRACGWPAMRPSKKPNRLRADQPWLNADPRRRSEARGERLVPAWKAVGHPHCREASPGKGQGLVRSCTQRCWLAAGHEAEN